MLKFSSFIVFARGLYFYKKVVPEIKEDAVQPLVTINEDAMEGAADTDKHQEQFSLLNMVKVQLEKWMCFQTVIVCYNMLITLSIYITKRNEAFIKCNADGTEWVSLNFFGSLFGMLHIVIVLLTAMQMEKVFYSVPKHMGYF